MKYIINAFTPKMLKNNANLNISVEPNSELEILKNKDNCISAIGHYNIAEHLGIEKKSYEYHTRKRRYSLFS